VEPAAHTKKTQIRVNDFFYSSQRNFFVDALKKYESKKRKEKCMN
jgi:hypothetical protein